NVDGAIACFRKVVEVDPRNANAYLGLGNALKARRKVDEAIPCLEKAVELDPRNAVAYGVLGQCLLGKGRHAEAWDDAPRAAELLPENHPLRALASRQVQTCERLLKLDERLPRLLRGEERPGSVPEHLALASICRRDRQLYAAAARLYAAA